MNPYINLWDGMMILMTWHDYDDELFSQRGRIMYIRDRDGVLEWMGHWRASIGGQALGALHYGCLVLTKHSDDASWILREIRFCLYIALIK